jgi:two-component SAPR family response regulator
MLRNILDSNQYQWPPGAGPTLRLVTREPGYLLQADQVSVDFESFAQLADSAYAAQMRHHRGASAALYGQAVVLYRGDFLANVDYDWAATHREWLRSRLLHALTFLAETAILSGDNAGVIHWCKQMLDAEPLHEETYRALILVHGHLGQLSQVHRWYRLCETRLRDHLQVAPQLATQRLYAQAVRGEYTGRPIDPQAWHEKLQPAGYPSLLQFGFRGVSLQV